MAPPIGMYMQSYYPAGYYRPPGMPVPPHLSQINPELLAQSNGQTNGVGPPESALRNTSAGTPKLDEDASKDVKVYAQARSASGSDSSNANSVSDPGPSSTGGERDGDASSNVGASADQNGAGAGAGTEGADASTLLRAVLAYQKEQEAREAAAAATLASASTQPDVPAQPPPEDAKAQTTETTGKNTVTDAPQAQAQHEVDQQRVPIRQPPDAGPSIVPVQVVEDDEDNPDLDAIGEPDHEMVEDVVNAAAPTAVSPPIEHLVAEDGTPMLNPGERCAFRVRGEVWCLTMLQRNC